MTWGDENREDDELTLSTWDDYLGNKKMNDAIWDENYENDGGDPTPRDENGGDDPLKQRLNTEPKDGVSGGSWARPPGGPPFYVLGSERVNE
jgi:hypothetical protein